MTNEQQKRYELPLSIAKSIPKQHSKKAAKNAYRMTTRAFLEAFAAREKVHFNKGLF